MPNGNPFLLISPSREVAFVAVIIVGNSETSAALGSGHLPALDFVEGFGPG